MLFSRSWGLEFKPTQGLCSGYKIYEYSNKSMYSNP